MNDAINPDDERSGKDRLSSVRRPRGSKSRDALLAAGQMLFGESGVDGVGIDTILKTAKVAKQSFYNHFPDKEALATEILHITRLEYETDLTRMNEGIDDPARRVARAISYYARRCMDDPGHASFVARTLARDSGLEVDVNRGVLADIAQGIAAGRLAAFAPDVGAAYALGCVQALMSRVLLDPSVERTAVLAQRFVTLTLRGFGLPALEAEIIATQAADAVIVAPFRSAPV